MNESKKDNGGRIEDSILIRFVRDTLKSMKCQNQGFVLDGFPKTYEQAKELFAGDKNYDFKPNTENQISVNI